MGTETGGEPPDRRNPCNSGPYYSIRSPEIALEITSCWICSVPSKMS